MVHAQATVQHHCVLIVLVVQRAMKLERQVRRSMKQLHICVNDFHSRHYVGHIVIQFNGNQAGLLTLGDKV